MKQRISITFGRHEMRATFVVTLETEYPCVAPCKIAYNLETMAGIIEDAIRESGSEVFEKAGPIEVTKKKSDHPRHNTGQSP